MKPATYRAFNNDGTEILPADIIVVYGQKCRVTRVLPLGTIEVEAVDSHRAFRVSGLWTVGK